MKISWTLSKDFPFDPNEPIGNICIVSFGIDNAISDEDVDLVFWIGAILQGLASLFKGQSYSADLITEPDPIQFKYTPEGLSLKYKETEVQISDIRQACQEACNKAQALIDEFKFKGHEEASKSVALLELSQKLDALHQTIG